MHAFGRNDLLQCKPFGDIVGMVGLAEIAAEGGGGFVAGLVHVDAFEFAGEGGGGRETGGETGPANSKGC